MRSVEWEIRGTVQRTPGERAKGAITRDEVNALLAKLSAVAQEQGLAFLALPRATRMNCPECGRILRGADASRCHICGARL